MLNYITPCNNIQGKLFWLTPNPIVLWKIGLGVYDVVGKHIRYVCTVCKIMKKKFGRGGGGKGVLVFL